MNFEEIESLWAQQPAPPVTRPDLAALRRVVLPELRRRSRLLAYGVFVASFGLVVGPLLAIVNYRHAPPPHAIWPWINVLLVTAVLRVWLVGLVRQLRRQRQLVQQRAETVRALATISLISLESEAKDFRRVMWQWPALLALQLVTLDLSFPVSRFGWAPFGGRASFALGLPALMILVTWRHCRVNLRPQVERQQEILRELE
jgi:MFS family permease